MIAGEEYRVTLAMVESRDPRGRPRDLLVIYEDETRVYPENAEFLLVYVRADQR